MNKALFIILSTVALDAIGIGLIFPILPELLRQVTGTGEISVVYGVMLALYAFMQFIFSPVLGVLSDRFGRRPVLLVSLAGAAVDYLVLAFAPELWMLVIGRAIAGLTSASMAVATAYITDITPEAQRAQRFGYFHALFGIGFIIGPIAGGLLGEWWVRAPFILAAVLNGANFALAYFVLPESRPGQKTQFDWKTLNPFGTLMWALTLKKLIPLIAIFVILNFVGQVYGTAWVLFTEDQFRWSALTIGLSFAGYGLFHAGAQMFLVGPVVAWLGERNALIAGMLFEMVALTIMAVATDGWMIFAILPLFALGGVGVPALQSLMTAEASADQQGQLQGVLSSLVSLTAIFGPLVYSGIYSWSRGFWPGLIWLLAVAIYLAAVPLSFTIRRRVAAPAQ